MPEALGWLATARDCFADNYGSLRQGLLTSVFSLVIGLERVFHLDDMADAGFARLTGGPPLPVALPGRRLAATPGLVRGRCLLPPHLPVAPDPQRRRTGQLRRACHPPLDEEVSHRQGLRHHPQQVHAL